MSNNKHCFNASVVAIIASSILSTYVTAQTMVQVVPKTVLSSKSFVENALVGEQWNGAICRINARGRLLSNNSETFISPGTAFFLAPNIAFTARHVIDKNWTLNAEGMPERNIQLLCPSKSGLKTINVVAVEVPKDTVSSDAIVDVVVLKPVTGQPSDKQVLGCAGEDGAAPDGTWLVAAGFPEGSVLSNPITALGTAVPPIPSQPQSATVQRATYAVAAAFSGGPVLNEHGAVVGVHNGVIGQGLARASIFTPLVNFRNQLPSACVASMASKTLTSCMRTCDRDRESQENILAIEAISKGTSWFATELITSDVTWGRCRRLC